MVFKEPKNISKIFKEMIDKKIKEYKVGVGIWQITNIVRLPDGTINDYRCQIKHLNFKYTLDNVPICGIGLGHKKGVIKYPNVGDFVVVAFADTKPFILGTVFDYFSYGKDAVPVIKLDELAIIQKENGSIIIMKDNNDVMIRSADATGNFDNGARIRINADGSFKLFNKGNFGIEVDKDGNMKLRAVTIDATQSAGTWQ